jgi:predicted HAD superfamily Cof-like phosphohydrolase
MTIRSPSQARVHDFHVTFALPHPPKPTLDEFTQVRTSLIQEELDELCVAWEKGDIVEMIDALCDLEYVVMGAAVALGLQDIMPFFNEVHRSNMSKVWPDGTVKYREDGKVLKPDSYSPADLRKIYRGVYGEEPDHG